MEITKLNFYKALKEYFESQTNRETQGWVARECEEIISNLNILIDSYKSKGFVDIANKVVIHHQLGPFGIKIEEIK